MQMRKFILWMMAIAALVGLASPIRSAMGSRQTSFVHEEGGNLPEGLVAVEYLESDGNQYIEIGSIVGTVALELTISATEIPESGCNKGCGIGYGANCQDDMGVNAQGWNGQYPCELEVPVVYRVDSLGFWFNGTKVGGNPAWFTDKIALGRVFVLFCGSSGSRAYRTSSGNYRAWRGRIYDCKMIGESGMVRHLIPVREGEGAEASGGLYDLVTGEVFGNNGQGSFVIGPDL